MRYLFSILLSFLVSYSFAQKTDYQQAWSELDAGNFKGAVSNFEKALNSKADKEKAQVMLCYLNSSVAENKKGHQYFKDLITQSTDASIYFRPLWHLNGVFGEYTQIGEYADSSVDLLTNRKDSHVYLKGMLADDFKFIALLNNKIIDTQKPFFLIKDWAIAGPIDNTMNAGFNKDYGLLNGAKLDASFKSKYGANVNWFKVQDALTGGYLYYSQYFNESNAMFYGQSFVEVLEDQELIVRFGYGGNLKMWVNDTEIYADQTFKSTYFDYFGIKLKLKKGWNRVLVQNSKYNGDMDAFSVGFTDLSGKPLNLNISNDWHEYNNTKLDFSPIQEPLIAKLKVLEKQNPKEPFYKFLLARDYFTIKDYEVSEEIISQELTLNPKNYVWLREMITLQIKRGNETLRSKYTEVYNELYPEDFDVMLIKLTDHIAKQNKQEAIGLISKIGKLYPNNTYVNDVFAPTALAFEGKIQEALENYHKVGEKYSTNKEFFNIYVKLLKQLNTPQEKIFDYYKKSLAAKYDYEIFNGLINEYESKGDVENALKLLEKLKTYTSFYIQEAYIANIYIKQNKYDKAIQIYEKLSKIRPTDASIYSELATLYLSKDDKINAIKFKELALKFSPFSIELNEKLRELKGQSLPYDITKPIDTENVIKDYQKNKKLIVEKEVEYVIDNKQFVIYKSNAVAQRITYMVRLNEESALSNWQETTIYSTQNSETQIFDVKTIKKNGTKIDADSEDGRYVFKNLEVGDYIFVDYVTRQNSGTRTSKFIEDTYYFNSFFPCYKSEYNLYYENGVQVMDTLLNGKIKFESTSKEGFNTKKWVEINSDIVKDEANATPLNENAKILFITTIKSWQDVSKWYADLSNIQAQTDPVVKKIYNELIENKNLDEEEKARVIYEYIGKNISYSSVDFRQGSHIPQKAAEVIQTKIGDCKDISTLFAAVGRQSGLDIDLVLVSTSDRGKNYLQYPSINFNHCIVKVNLKNGPKYLELTDNYLPYGYLSSTLKNAQILDIPFSKTLSNNKLKILNYNKGYENSIIRNTTVMLKQDLKIEINRCEKKVGNEASINYNAYINLSEKDQKDKLKEMLANAFKSKVNLKEADFKKLVARKDTSEINYTFTAENEVLKVGSLRSLKIPFTDLLAQNALFDEEESRSSTLNFNKYEPTDIYQEDINIVLHEKFKFEEIPKNITLNFGKFAYTLLFKAIAKNQLIVSRKYVIERKNIEPKEYIEFKNFMQAIIEAENTNVVFK